MSILDRKISSKVSGALGLGAFFAAVFIFTPTSPAEAETSLSQATQPIQLASTQRRYNFSRERIRSQRYFYKKKRKYRPKAKRLSYRQKLKAVQTWPVDEDNKDPIQLVVSRSEQKITVYKGSEIVTTSNVSSGKKGHETPTGVFSILGKRVFHRSNIYSAAPMPYMQRLTWSGIALHASNSVPNHPASHGCVRLPNSFAPKLFKFTERGAHVIIADEKPRIVELSGLDILKPLSLEDREKEIAKLKEKLIAEKISEMKAAQEKEAAQKATPSSDKTPAPEEKEIASVEPETPDVEVELSESPVRILITRRLGRERVMDVQDMLREMGFDPGESDGYMGKDTGKAIIAFQKANGLKETGAFSDELESQLYKLARNKVAPTGYIYVRQDFKNVFAEPITLKDPHLPLGTHLITAQFFDIGDTQVRWRAMTLKDEVPDFLAQEEQTRQKQSDNYLLDHPIKLASNNVSRIKLVSNAPQETTPQSVEKTTDNETIMGKEQKEEELNAASRKAIEAVLARIVLPDHVVKKLSFMLTPGSSIAISDKGLSKETTPHGTDFILLTR